MSTYSTSPPEKMKNEQALVDEELAETNENVVTAFTQSGGIF